jgi:hypothetical protein
MRKLLLICFIPLIIFAQEGINVELPDFVITGQDLINLQQTKKPEAELIPVISEDFIRPVINPEQLDIKEVAAADINNLSLRDSINYNTGRIKTLLGIYTLPYADMSISTPFNSGTFQGFLTGENIRPYIDNAERYFLKGGLGLSLFSGYESTFLPGTHYLFNGDFGSKSFKFFAGSEPALKRNIYQGSFGTSVKNIYYEKFLMGASAGYKLTSLKDEDYSENKFSLDGFSRFNLGSFNGGFSLKYDNQMAKDSIRANAVYNYFMVRPYAGFEFSRFFRAAFGLTYAHAGNNNFVAPYANAGFRLSRYFSISGEYAPAAEFITSSDMLDNNRYFDPQNNPNVFVKNNHDLRAALKYEYNVYFEVNGGVRIRVYDNLPYYSEISPEGKFSLNTTKAESYGLFINLLFHRGPLGYLYASGEMGEMKNKENNLVPYFPSLISSLTYGYDFPIGLNAETNLSYRSAVYADSANTEKLSAYINLNVNLSYNLSQNLKLIAAFNNLLDRKNYIWNKYREIPMDLTAGISYIW